MDDSDFALFFFVLLRIVVVFCSPDGIVFDTLPRADEEVDSAEAVYVRDMTDAATTTNSTLSNQRSEQFHTLSQKRLKLTYKELTEQNRGQACVHFNYSLLPHLILRTPYESTVGLGVRG